MSTPVLLDCDPGHDDAIAMLLALGSDELDVRGITTVAGNQTLEKTTANAIRVLELAGRAEIPVAAGDSFTACLVVSLLEERDREEALRRACAAGAVAASRAGAQPSLPTAAEVDEMLRA